jgi:triacylglycerol lipase
MLRNEESDRGISHGDMIDLNRENIKGLDIREFYVGLVSELREKGF